MSDMQMKGEDYGRKYDHRISFQSSSLGNGDRQCDAGIFPKRGRRQNSNHPTKVLLSTLWIVVMINMLNADILSLYIPGSAEEVARVSGETPISTLMLGGAIMMELSIVMIFLSRVLRYKVNR